MGKLKLPARVFRMALQAIRGDFSPPEDQPDHEREDDLLLDALTTFPAKLRLKVVSRPASDLELDRCANLLGVTTRKSH